RTRETPVAGGERAHFRAPTARGAPPGARNLGGSRRARPVTRARAARSAAWRAKPRGLGASGPTYARPRRAERRLARETSGARGERPQLRAPAPRGAPPGARTPWGSRRAPPVTRARAARS